MASGQPPPGDAKMEESLAPGPSPAPLTFVNAGGIDDTYPRSDSLHGIRSRTCENHECGVHAEPLSKARWGTVSIVTPVASITSSLRSHPKARGPRVMLLRSDYEVRDCVIHSRRHDGECYGAGDTALLRPGYNDHEMKCLCLLAHAVCYDISHSGLLLRSTP